MLPLPSESKTRCVAGRSSSYLGTWGGGQVGDGRQGMAIKTTCVMFGDYSKVQRAEIAESLSHEGTAEVGLLSISASSFPALQAAFDPRLGERAAFPSDRLVGIQGADGSRLYDFGGVN